MNPTWIKGGESPNPSGRPRGKSPETILRELKPIALAKLELAVKSGDPTACAAVVRMILGA